MGGRPWNINAHPICLACGDVAPFYSTALAHSRARGQESGYEHVGRLSPLSILELVVILAGPKIADVDISIVTPPVPYNSDRFLLAVRLWGFYDDGDSESGPHCAGNLPICRHGRICSIRPFRAVRPDARFYSTRALRFYADARPFPESAGFGFDRPMRGRYKNRSTYRITRRTPARLKFARRNGGVAVSDHGDAQHRMR